MAANSSAEMLVHVGIILISAPRRSVIATMQLNPPSSRRGPTKSIATQSPHPCGTGRGCNGLIGDVVEDLFH